MWLELDGEGLLHRQCYRALREAILEERVAPGARLPSSRGLARELGLARNTVSEAYRQLLAEGYAQTRRGAGTFVSETLPAASLGPPLRVRGTAPWPRPAGLRLSRYGERVEAVTPPGGARWSFDRGRLPFDFLYGEPAFHELPYAAWCRVLSRCARKASRRDLGYAPPAGVSALREALASYLTRSRGVRCQASQVIIVNGSQQAIDLVVRLLVDPGETVILEEPHYGGLALALDAQGAASHAIEVDDAGLRTDRLPNSDAPGRAPRLVCVTPSHQFPTGAVMPLSRRLELLAWAHRTGAWVLEDDYDGELRYDGRPLASLQGLDEQGRVLYLGTSSKLLFPSLRIGWLVVPESLTLPFTSAKAFADTGSAGLEQRALADFITSGQFERHVRRARVRNASRRGALLEAIEREMPGSVEVGGASAGLHVVLWLHDASEQRATEVRRAAEAIGVGVYPVRPFYRNTPGRAGLMLGYASLQEDEIREGIRRLATVMRAAGSTVSSATATSKRGASTAPARASNRRAQSRPRRA